MTTTFSLKFDSTLSETLLTSLLPLRSRLSRRTQNVAQMLLFQVKSGMDAVKNLLEHLVDSRTLEDRNNTTVSPHGTTLSTTMKSRENLKEDYGGTMRTSLQSMLEETDRRRRTLPILSTTSNSTLLLEILDMEDRDQRSEGPRRGARSEVKRRVKSVDCWATAETVTRPNLVPVLARQNSLRGGTATRMTLSGRSTKVSRLINRRRGRTRGSTLSNKKDPRMLGLRRDLRQL